MTEEDKTPPVTAKTGDIEDVTVHPLVLLSAADLAARAEPSGDETPYTPTAAASATGIR